MSSWEIGEIEEIGTSHGLRHLDAETMRGSLFQNFFGPLQVLKPKPSGTLSWFCVSPNWDHKGARE